MTDNSLTTVGTSKWKSQSQNAHSSPSDVFKQQLLQTIRYLVQYMRAPFKDGDFQYLEKYTY